MPDENVQPLFSDACEKFDSEGIGTPKTERRSLLESPLTNEELLDRIPHQIKCLGALSVVTEANDKIKKLKTVSDTEPEL